MDEAIPIRLHCPECHRLHLDEGIWATKLHHTHACQHCGAVWRPALVHTVGVPFLPGFKNDEESRQHFDQAFWDEVTARAERIENAEVSSYPVGGQVTIQHVATVPAPDWEHWSSSESEESIKNATPPDGYLVTDLTDELPDGDDKALCQLIRSYLDEHNSGHLGAAFSKFTEVFRNTNWDMSPNSLARQVDALLFSDLTVGGELEPALGELLGQFVDPQTEATDD